MSVERVEIAALPEIVAALDRGHHVVITGATGMGKSRLAAEIAAHARRTGNGVLSTVSTGSLSAIPFGAFLTVIDPSERGGHPGTPLDSTGHIAEQLALRILQRGTRVIVADDAHLLDADSAALLHQLAGQGVVLVLVVPDLEVVENGSLRSIATGDSVVWHEVSPLSDAGVEIQACECLRGPVDGALTAELVSRSGGNPLLVRELIRSGLGSGAIERRRGLWVATRRPPAVTTLRALLSETVLSLEPEHRRLIELMVLADPLPLALAERLTVPTVLDSVESLGLALVVEGTDPHLIPVNPIMSEVVAASLPQTRRHRLLGELIAAAQSDAGRRVRVGRWRLQRGDQMSAADLRRLADESREGSPGHVELFLRAAVAAGGGIDALLRLARHWAQQQQASLALSVLASVDRLEPPGEVVAEVELLRISVMARSTTEPEAALARIERNRTRVTDEPRLVAAKVTSLWRLGRVSEAIALALHAALDDVRDRALLVDVLVIASYAAIYAGDRVRFAELGERITVLAAAREALPDGPETLPLLEAGAAQMQGVPLAVTVERDLAGYRRSLNRGDSGVRAQFAAELGWARALGGDISGAAVLLGEAQAATGAWAATSMPWVLSLYVRVLAVAGRQAEAEDVLAELLSEQTVPVYDTDIALAEVAVLARRTSLHTAGVRARDAAAGALALGQNYMARVCWQVATSLGDRASAGFLSESIGTPTTPSDRAVLAHADAVVRLDAAALEVAAALLAGEGLVWFAIDAQAQAVSIHYSNGNGRAAAIATERLEVMRSETVGLLSPVVERLVPAHLTRRESEIARLASAGHGDRKLAEMLGISIRTVQTHLARVYAKLGVSGRKELAARLRPPVFHDPARGQIT